MNLTIAAGSLVVGLLTGVVIAVAYLHRVFALRADLESLAGRVEAEVNYVRGRIDVIVDRLAGK